jgi:ABC-2 type transport system ATP-binding protein
MILVDSLSRCYGDFTAVDQVSFEIGKGEIVGLLGHNGAGKTTIMKMLTGFLEPDDGVIRIDGLDIREQAQQVKSRIGYLPENLPLYPEMLVASYLDYVAGLRGLKGAGRWQSVRDAIDKTDLQDKALQPIATLSRGYRQRVGVAQAILHRPKVLILDEPTNGLDPTQTMHMRTLIRQCTEHATVILSTHIMQEVDAICDRVMILRNGRLAVDESLSTLGQGKTLILETDVATGILREVIDDPSEIVGIELKEKQGDDYVHALQLAEHANLRHAAAAVTHMLVDAGHSVHAIYPYKRDLESLFREVNAGKEYVDVA